MFITTIVGSISVGAVLGLGINAVQWYTSHRTAVGIASRAAAGVAARVGHKVAEKRETSDSPVKAKSKA